MMGESKVVHGIVVANVTDHITNKWFVVRQFSVFDILSDNIAEETSKILVTRKGKKGPRIGEHSDEVG